MFSECDLFNRIRIKICSQRTTYLLQARVVVVVVVVVRVRGRRNNALALGCAVMF
jgi:hypothetical protein